MCIHVDEDDKVKISFKTLNCCACAMSMYWYYMEKHLLIHPLQRLSCRLYPCPHFYQISDNPEDNLYHAENADASE